MKIKVISCEALAREFYAAAAASPHVLDLKFLAFGLHNTPDDLRKTIQAEIDDSEGKGYDCIILGYGLCSRGTAEIRARSVQIVVTRAHDCITLLLGSRANYDREFGSHPGTYYYSPGWIERKEGEMDQGSLEWTKGRLYKERYEAYVEKYGEDNAKYLMEQESQWLANYTRAAFINMGIGAIEEYRCFTQKLAQDHDWEYEEIPGSLSLIQRLVNGEWETDDFLIVPPNSRIAESFDALVLKTEC